VPEPPIYFAYADGRQLGPLRFAELADLAAREVLKPEDLVWQSETPDWVPASSVLAFPKKVLLDLRPDDSVSFHDPASAAPETPAPTAVASTAALAGTQPAAFFSAATTTPPREDGFPARDPSKLIDRTVRVQQGSLIKDLRSFSLLEILSLRRLVDAETLGAPLTWTLLIFGLGPLVVGSFVGDPALRVRLFNFGCGAAWTVFFAGLFKTPRQSLKLGLTLFFSTGVFALVFVSLLREVPPLSWLAPFLSPSQPFLLRLLATVLGVGFLEEAGKGLILILLARALGGLEDAADGVFYGLMAGLGFGVYEALSFTEWIQPGQAGVLASALDPTIGLYAYAVSGIAHVMSLPLLQALWSALFGCFVGLSASAHRKQNAVVFIGLVLASLLHGLYEAFAATGATVFSLLVAATTVLFFLTTRKNADRLAAEVRRADTIA
jgi:RsiW-degrading membrane proteinase PrsW (M82 family)